VSSAGPTRALLDAIRSFLEHPVGRISVGRLHDAARAALAVAAAQVFLSADTLAKQRREHPELTEADYLLLPSVLETPDLVLEWQGLRVAVLRTGAHDLIAIVKATAERHETYVVSFRRTERKDVLRMVRKGRIIFGDATGWPRR